MIKIFIMVPKKSPNRLVIFLLMGNSSLELKIIKNNDRGKILIRNDNNTEM